MRRALVFVAAVTPENETLVAVAAFPVVLWLNVGKFVMLAALMVGAVWKVGTAALPEGAPANTELFGASV
jgi:hypothetical protein